MNKVYILLWERNNTSILVGVFDRGLLANEKMLELTDEVQPGDLLKIEVRTINESLISEIKKL